MKYGALQGAHWMLAAVGMAFMTPLFEAKGFSSVEIGWLNAAKYISVIVFQIWIAAFSDKHAEKIPLKWIMELMGVVSMIAAGAFFAMENDFIQAVVVCILYGATVNCLAPIVDSLSIQYLNHGRNLNYTLARSCGSVTWAFACVGIGSFADAFGINHILLLQIASTLLFVFICIMMDPVDFSEVEPVTEKDEEEKQRLKTGSKAQQHIGEKECPEKMVHSSWYLICNYPKYALFLVGCLVFYMGYNLNATFMIDIIERLGGSHSDLGLSEFVLAISEIPVMLFFPKLRKHFSLEQLMVVCVVFCTLRAAATTFAPNVLCVILAQGFEILGMSIYYAGSVFFVMENLPDTDVVKGVSFINVAAVGLGQVFASVLCGMIKAALGLEKLLFISIGVSFVSVLIMLVMVKAPRERKSGLSADRKAGMVKEIF